MLDTFQIGFWHGLSCTHDALQPSVAGTHGGGGGGGGGVKGAGEEVFYEPSVSLLSSRAEHSDTGGIQGQQIQSVNKEQAKA